MKCSDGHGFALGNRKRSPEYPCVSRFRQRRLLSLLMRQELYNTFDALIGESDALMYPGRLTELVQEGQWEEAMEYLSRFLPSDRLLSVHGRTLLHFLRVHKAIDDIVASAPEGRAVSAALKVCFTLDAVRSQGITKLRAMLWSLICYTERRASLDLERVRDKAASIIIDLASQTPELKQLMTYARGPMKPHNVLPIGFGFRPRRHVKRGPIPGSVLVRHYLRKRTMLPSSTSSHCEALSFASLIKAKGWMVDLIDTSLKAGQGHQGNPLQSGSNEGAPVGAVSQNNLGTSRSTARHSSVSSDTDIDDRLEAWPDMSQGNPPIRRSVDKDGARVLQTIPDTFTRPAESSAIPSFTKAGALSSEAMPTKYASPSEYPVISIVENTGTLSSGTVSAIWKSPSENSLISAVTNAGTHKHVSPEHCYTENACQDISARKNPRIELTTAGQGHNPKRQRTNLGSRIEGETEDHLSACS